MGRFLRLTVPTTPPKTGDAAQITANLRIDGGGANAVDDTNPTELEDGFYFFNITQAESNGDYILISPVSSTSDIQVIGCPAAVFTTAPNFNTLGIESDGDLTKVNALDGHTAQTGDSYAIVSGDHGLVSIQDDVDAILEDTGTTLPATLTTIEGKVDDVDTVVDGIQTDLDNGVDGLGALKTLIDAVPTASEIQTEMEENGASILDTLQDRLTAARAGYLDELNAATVGKLAWYMAKLFIDVINKKNNHRSQRQHRTIQRFQRFHRYNRRGLRHRWNFHYKTQDGAIMSMTIDVEQIWKDGGYAKDNPLDRTIAYLEAEGTKEGVDKSEIDLMVVEFFVELASGATYSTEKCSCGCGIDKSGTDAIHALRQRIRDRGRQLKTENAKQRTDRLNSLIIAHMARENALFTAKYGPDAKAGIGRALPPLVRLAGSKTGKRGNRWRLIISP